MFDKILLLTCLLTASQSHYPQPLSARVLNGHDAVPGEIPFRVSMQWSIPPFSSRVHFCGGAILDEQWILTRAECVRFIQKYNNTREIVVKTGKNDLGKIEKSEQTSKIAVVHVNHDFFLDEKRGQVGLVKLSTPLVFNNNVTKIKVAQLTEGTAKIVTMSGWGPMTDKNSEYTTVLQVANVRIIPHEDCEKMFHESTWKRNELTDNIFYEENFCTERISETACGGDFGSPITMTNSSNDTILVGLTSWGLVPPCTQPSSPLVFIKIAVFLKWINNIIYAYS
ncbi:trypsin-1-like [Copidosoma floridanum]|uniref:trypsin-1-like n=1 Tax=Copidosoma floridanum TaxID=29053 RepID=UPI0006C9D6E4|nr:trypsin-1-like [Copidosoma floridanum]